MVDNEETPLLRSHPIRDCHEGQGVNPERTSSRLIIYGSYIGIFLAAADESFLFSTWSMIASEFNSLSWGSWLLVTYNFGYCISLPVYGALCGAVGRRNVLLGAYGLFAAGCLVCSEQWYQYILYAIGTREIHRRDVAPPEEVALLRGYANVINASARSLGAPLGGLLVGSIGWRWIPSNSDRSYPGASAAQEDATDSNTSRFDYGGLLSFILAMALFFTTLQALSSITYSSQLPLLIPATAVSIITFIVIEAYWAGRPLIPLALFRTSIGAYLANQVMLTGCHSALLSNLVPYLIRVEDRTNLFASSAFIVAATGVSGGSLLAVIAVCGLVFGFFLMFIRWRVRFSPWELIYLFPSGVFLGVLFVTQFTAMSLVVAKEDLAVSITTYYFFQQLGSIMGPATSVAAVQRGFEGQLERNLKGLPEEKFIGRIINDARFARTLNPDVQSIVQRSYRNTFQFAPLISLMCSLAMLPSVSWLNEREVK
ncbi:hypothetical protein BBP40_010142 [Aspergillus hancockii]|nr:hypothetical protein BBP40_010142 [Aspergillus hancockii]